MARLTRPVLRAMVAVAATASCLGDRAGAGASAIEEREPFARSDEAVVVVRCEMRGKGEFDVNVVPKWAPLGAQQFLDMVEDGFFDGTALFRAVDRFLVQFGIAKDPALNSKWANKVLKDDPKIGVRIRRGTLAFAGGGVNSRAAQMFVALSDHSWPHLGREPWETPFGYISKADMERVWARVNTEYGDMKPWGKRGVDVGKIWTKGYKYLEDGFPNMDYLSRCAVVAYNEPAGRKRLAADAGESVSAGQGHLEPQDDGELREEELEPGAEPMLERTPPSRSLRPSLLASSVGGLGCDSCVFAIAAAVALAILALAASLVIRRRNIKRA